MKSALQARLEKLSTDGVDALKEMTDYFIERLEVLRKTRDQMFNDKLERFENMAASVFTDRLAAPMGGTQARPETRTIFDHALSPNFSLQLVRSVIHFILARIDKDTFGSRPWLAVGARKTISQALAAEIQKHGEYKLMECLWRDKARGGLQSAFNLGFCPVKTAWREDWDASEHEELILCGPDGEPIVTQAGDYIYPEDDTQEAAPEPMPGAQGMPLGQPPMAPPAAGAMPDDESQEPVGDPDAAAEGEQPADNESAEAPGLNDEAQEGEMPVAPRVFAKAPEIPAPDGENGLQWKSHLIEETQRLYAGLDFSPLNWRDVAYPINAGQMDLSDSGCDFIGVTSSQTVEQILATYGKGREEDEEWLALITELRSGGTGTPKSADAQPNRAQREPEVSGNDRNNPTIKVSEGYFRRRVMPTGPESRVFMVVAEESRKVIYAEYLTIVSPRGQAPVHQIAINRVPGRAYGKGFFELFEMAANQLDKLFNGIIVRNEYHANTANFIDKRAAADLASGSAITIGPGTWNEIDGKLGPLPSLFYQHNMPEMDENTWKMVELIMQLIQTESGVTNASQGDMTDLPANSTATGVNSMLESSSVLHTFTLEECRSCLTPPLRYALELTYFRQDGDEEYDVLDDASALQQLEQAETVAAQGPPQGTGAAPAAPPGQPGVMTFAQAKALANVPLNVEILLSRAKRQEQREAALAAIPQAQSFYQMPPQMQLKLLPLFVQVMQGLDISNPDRIFPSPAEIQAQIVAQANQPPDTSEERVSLRENMNYEKVPPSIKRQMEAAAGFKPADPKEAAEFEATQQKPDAIGKKPKSDAETPAETAAPSEEQEPPQAAA